MENRTVVTLLELTDEAAIGLFSNTLAIYYLKTPTLATAMTVDTLTCRIADELGRLTVMVVIEAANRTPEPNVRKAIEATMQKVEPKITSVAYAVLGAGFGSAAVRAVISGQLLLVRHAYPAKVFSSVPSAVTWLRSLCTKSETLRQQQDVAEIYRFCSRERYERYPRAAGHDAVDFGPD
jgi:hypothetical protein